MDPMYNNHKGWNIKECFSLQSSRRKQHCSKNLTAQILIFRTSECCTGNGSSRGGVTLACCLADISAHAPWDGYIHLANSCCCSGCIHMWLLKQGGCHAANPVLCDSMHHALLNCYKEYSPQLWGWYAVQAWQRLSTTNRVQLS